MTAPYPVLWNDKLYDFVPMREVGASSIGYMLTEVGWVTAVCHGDGTVFTVTDWRGRQPDVMEDDEILEAAWMGESLTVAVVIDGLPRKLPA